MTSTSSGNISGNIDNDPGGRQAASTMRGEDIRAVVAETLAEQQRLHHDDIDDLVFRTVATILTSFGIEEVDRV